MKKLLILITLPYFLYAQSDSTKVSFTEEKVEKFEKTTLIDEYEKAFGGNKIVKSGLRVRANDWNRYSNNLNLQFEKKIGNSFSLIPNLNLNYAINFKVKTNFELEARYYYQMKKRIKEGKQQPNLNGNFLSGKASFIGNNNSKYFSYILNEKKITLVWGKQIGNFLEYGISAGVINGAGINPKSGNYAENIYMPFLTTTGQVGLGLLFPKTDKYQSNFCEFLMCNYDVKKMTKINMNDVLYINKFNQSINLDIAYERKIGKSPFSFNSNLVLEYTNFKSPRDTISAKTTGFGKFVNNNYVNIEIGEQLRYYISMQKRIKKGISASNLNGIYTGVEFKKKYSKTFNFLNYSNFGLYDPNLFGAIFGYQTKTSLNSFLDVNCSTGLINFNRKLKNDEIIIFWNPNLSREPKLYFEINVKFGIAK